MSQITRCPYCATTFKVVKDQLRISDGWVRCGQCKEVFDAHEHMVVQEHAPLLPQMPLDDLQAPIRPVPVSQPPLEPLIESSFGQPPEALPESSSERQVTAPEVEGYELPGASLPDFEWQPEPETETETLPDVASTPPPQDESDQPLEAVEAEPAQQQSEPLPAQESELAEETLPVSAEALVNVPADIPAEVATNTHVDVPAELADDDRAGLPEAEPVAEPGFVRAARRNAFWRMPVVRGVLALVMVVLLIGLALQVALHNRDTIASQHPAARAWLASLCEPLQCTLQAPRHIEAVVIDSSSFLKARNDPTAYQLQMSLKNTSTLTVAMPALELTLTDAQDQPILRRVLQGDELAAPTELAPGFVWNGTVSLQVTQGAAQVAGYRLLAFYP